MSIASLQSRVQDQSCAWVRSTRPGGLAARGRGLNGTRVVRCGYARHGRLGEELSALQADLLARDKNAPSTPTPRISHRHPFTLPVKPWASPSTTLRPRGGSSSDGLSGAGVHDILRYEVPEAPRTCTDPVCQLDVTRDPVETLQQLRQCLNVNGSATLLVSDSRPNVLLDAVSLIHLLNQDLRLEEDYSTVVVFQPILTDLDPQLQPPGSNSSSMALHVIKLQAPELLQQLPSCVMAHATGPKSGSLSASSNSRAPIPRSSTTAEVWTIADRLVERLDARIMTQLRCMGPRSLVIAFRAIMRARKLLQLAGDADVLVSPQIVTDKSKSMVCFNCWRSEITSARDSLEGHGIELI